MKMEQAWQVSANSALNRSQKQVSAQVTFLCANQLLAQMFFLAYYSNRFGSFVLLLITGD